MKNKRLFAYIRISPNPRKNSPELNQKIEIQRYCSSNNIIIKKQFSDLQISGKSLKREEFQKMLNRLDEVDGIVIFDVTRFARNVNEGIPLFLQILNQKKEIHLVKNNKILDYSNENYSTWDLLVPIIEFFQGEEYLKNLHIRQAIGIKRYKDKNGRWGKREYFFNKEKYIELKFLNTKNRIIAKELGISERTLYRRVKEIKEVV